MAGQKRKHEVVMEVRRGRTASSLSAQIQLAARCISFSESKSSDRCLLRSKYLRMRYGRSDGQMDGLDRLDRQNIRVCVQIELRQFFVLLLLLLAFAQKKIENIYNNYYNIKQYLKIKLFRFSCCSCCCFATIAYLKFC